ncbi:recombinase family protein [Paenibacillus donghaensis]|uniref:recombinase family protein n=1 Tax=Paenibacillus donghaensis TaxID=414771 RepID=UPI001883C4F1|nr:recombinase family protein [Paenibacillus donghaensis]MBE9913676.1 recombinase family protein [Paenibacillus donghaensis]
MTTNKTKVAIYTRVNQEQEELGNQLQALHAYCEANGKEIYAEYVDEGVSGMSMEGRHSLRRLLEDAEKQAFQEVIVWKLNRLARRSIELIILVDKLDQRHVQVRSMTENLDFSTPSGKFALQMLATVYEFEYNTAIENKQFKLD